MSKKLTEPVQNRLMEKYGMVNDDNKGVGGSGKPSKSKNKCRRSKVKRNRNKEIIVMYANIQGVRGKLTSLKHVMSETGADIIMLAETMTRNVSIEGCQCINPKVSVGQNVSIILAGKVCNSKKMKLYEPNESLNMIGIRVEINKS